MNYRNFFFLFLVLPASAEAQQSVFLDFDSGDHGSINYTTSMRNEIESQLGEIYGEFGIRFQQTLPTSNAFSTIHFNSGSTGGVAEAIDFRNLNHNDIAIVNIDGLGFSSIEDLTRLSSNVAAHELGHLLGLRHHDSFGPIGSGVLAGLDTNFLPDYHGPQNAIEFENHVMSTPSFGADLNRFTQPVWLSERSAIKLASITQCSVVNEATGYNDTMRTAQSLELTEMLVPNTIQSGLHADVGEKFSVDSVTVLGSLESSTGFDFYQFEAEAGDLFNFELMSQSLHRIADDFDAQITIIDDRGEAIDYYGVDAFNDDEIETLDAILVDLVIPETGTYFARVGAFGGIHAFGEPGEYELFFHRFNGAAVAVPEPSTVCILMTLALVAVTRRRRSVA